MAKHIAPNHKKQPAKCMEFVHIDFIKLSLRFTTKYIYIFLAEYRVDLLAMLGF